MPALSKPSEKSDDSVAQKAKHHLGEGPFTRLSAFATFSSAAIALFALFMAWDSEKLAGLAFWRSPTITSSLPESIVLSEFLGLARVSTTLSVTQNGGPKTTIARAALKFTNTDTRIVFELGAKTIRLDIDRTNQLVPWRSFGMQVGRSLSQSIDFEVKPSKADFIERRELAFKAGREHARLPRSYESPSYFVSGSSTKSTARGEASVAPSTEAKPKVTFDETLRSQLVAFRSKHNPFRKGLHELCLQLFDDENRLVSHAGYRFNLDAWEVDALEEEFNRSMFLDPSVWSVRSSMWSVSALGGSSSKGDKVPEVTLESSRDAKCADTAKEVQ